MKWKYSELDIDYTFDISIDEYEERTRKVRRAMEERNIDLGVAWGMQLFPGDITYLSGFDVNLEVGAMILLTQDDLYLLTGPEAYPAAKIDIKNGEPFAVYDLSEPEIDYSRTSGVTTVKDCISRMFKGRNPQRVAFLTFDDFLTVKAYNSVFNTLPSCTEILYATDILYNLRLSKSVAEQRLMTYAAAIATEGMKAVLNNAKPRMMEVQWGAFACAKMRGLGAHALTFDPVIQSGPRINTCIGRTYNKIIKEGEIVSIDVGCRYKHYAGHLGRTIVAGKPTKKQLDFLKMGVEAAEAAGAKIIYNTSMSNTDKAAYEVFARYGYGKYSTYSVGHGTGFTDGMGEGAATQKSKGLWPKNIAMMTDVSLNNVPELCGFRFEDGFIIDNDGVTHNITSGLPLEVFL